MSETPVSERNPNDTPEVRLKCWELYKHGFSYGQIGEAVKITRAEARVFVEATMKELAEEVIGDKILEKQLDLLRLNDMLPKFLEAARKGDAVAAEKVLKILERRAKYLGLDAPAKSEVHVGSLEDLVAESNELGNEDSKAQ